MEIRIGAFATAAHAERQIDMEIIRAGNVDSPRRSAMKRFPLHYTVILGLALLALFAAYRAYAPQSRIASFGKGQVVVEPDLSKGNPRADATYGVVPDTLGHATFAGGCFWSMEEPFEKIQGVQSVTAGYSGGSEPNPTYNTVETGKTGYAETVDIVYDPKKVSYSTLLEEYWRSINPTDSGGQFVDRGPQYRPVIFARNAEQKRLAEDSKSKLGMNGRFRKPIVVAVADFQSFTPAEPYHQDYAKKNPKEYGTYRRGSGRAQFFAGTWGTDHPVAPVIPVDKGNDGMQDAVAAANAVSDTVNAAYVKPSAAEIRKKLTPLQYEVTQRNGTEPAYSNAYWDNHKAGLYVDIVTGEPLFSSKDKFESGTGWPSFTRPIAPDAVKRQLDSTMGMRRTEVRSSIGDSHLGHLFDDGPPPTRMRYCINSASLRFIPKDKLAQEGYGEFESLFQVASKP
jgi:peptide methionine sulfoxide reductase msrA/msrB